MPTTLGPPFQPDFPGLPTGISLEDLQLWWRYRPQLPTDTTSLYFNVRLGDGKPAGANVDAEWRNYWYTVTSKRADVIVQTPTEIQIIELRNNATANAIGRLLMYRTLWNDDPPLPGTARAILVTNLHDPDVARQAHLSDITYTIV
jgi:hypothetical protein